MNAAEGKPELVVVCGPTGIGKTAAAIAIAQAFRGEIISADSMQIYKYMDIGTAKPTPEQQAAVPHHLIDIVEPSEDFSAAQYARLAGEKVTALHRQGVLPVVVGGTGLYIKALVQGLFRSAPIEPHIRQRLQEEAAAGGSASLYERLRRHDPETARRLHPNDTFRILRALEVFEATGRRISAYQQAHRFADENYHALKIGLQMERAALFARINHRVETMIGAGLVDEVRGLLDRGYAPELKAMQSIGYRHIVKHIRGQADWEETRRTLKRDTRRYAKRQLTWFGADPAINWKEPGRLEEMQTLVRRFLEAAA
ncbi:MAG: tRNA (adenosine(37)-N6)-dimethylallyltransferase MiaA [Desulfobacterales bacterium]|nr:MAG: tRNA (adenosine(37)-N6)-dimethylallyltransferase MiaA [Desulfobacterales bacterium]